MSITRKNTDFCILHVANLVRAQPFKRLVFGMLCSPKLAPQTPRIVDDVARIMMESILYKTVGEMECIRTTDCEEVYRVDEKNILTYNSVKPNTSYKGSWFRVQREENNAVLGYFYDHSDLWIDMITPANDGITKETYGVIIPADDSTKDFRDITSLGEMCIATARYEYVTTGFKLLIEGMPMIGRTNVPFGDCSIPIEHGLFCDGAAVRRWMDVHYEQTLGDLAKLDIEVLFYHLMPVVSIEVNDGGKVYVTRRPSGELRFQIERGIKRLYMRGIRALAYVILNSAFPVATLDHYENDPRIEQALLTDPGFDIVHDDAFVDDDDDPSKFVGMCVYHMEDIDWFEIYGNQQPE